MGVMKGKIPIHVRVRVLVRLSSPAMLAGCRKALHLEGTNVALACWKLYVICHTCRRYDRVHRSFPFLPVRRATYRTYPQVNKATRRRGSEGCRSPAREQWRFSSDRTWSAVRMRAGSHDLRWVVAEFVCALIVPDGGVRGMHVCDFAPRQRPRQFVVPHGESNQNFTRV